jgi:hypothetical protein
MHLYSCDDIILNKKNCEIISQLLQGGVGILEVWFNIQ